jgi:hypothetical protein
MRTKHTGIFERTIIETTEEWFRGGGGLLGSVNSVFAIADCAKRARQAFRKVFNLPEHISTKPRSVIVRLDSSRRPLTETMERDENRYLLEMLRLITACCNKDSLLRLKNLSRRDPRNNPIAADVRALLFDTEVFYRTWEEREALVRKQDEWSTVDLLAKLILLDDNLQSLAMRIVELDIRIAVTPFEPKVQHGQKRLRLLGRMRRGRKIKGDATKTLWKLRLRRLISKHPKWTNHAIAKEARKNPPKYLKRVALSTLQDWLKEVR